MGAFLDTPNTEKYNEHGSGNDLQYGVAMFYIWNTSLWYKNIYIIK